MRIDSGVLTLANGDKKQLRSAVVSVDDRGVLKLTMDNIVTHFSPSGWVSYSHTYKKPAAPSMGS